MNRKQRRMENKIGRGADGTSQAVLRWFADAVAHHEAGRLADAMAGYEKIIGAAPDFIDAIYNLGVALAAQGRLDEAAICYRRTLFLNPRLPGVHNNLGNVLRQQGQLRLATASFNQAITLQPDYAEAHNNLGNVLRDSLDLDGAVKCFRRAIALKPIFVEAHSNLGDALRISGSLDAAETSCRRAIALQPGFAEAHNNLGLVLLQQRRAPEAAACYRAALGLQPGLTAPQCNLGAALDALGCLDDAVAAHQAAIAHDPALAQAHSNLGDTLRKLGRPGDAVPSYRTALALRPESADVHNSLGRALDELGQFDAATTSYRRALDLRPDCPATLTNLGDAWRKLGRLDAAEACYRKALALEPDVAETHFQLGMTLLAGGDMAAGWQEYEWRWRTSTMLAARRDFTQPQWTGTHAPGQTLLIHAEQGYGDTLQFCRYATLAAGLGLRVVMEVQPPLVRLMRSLPGVDQVVARGDALPEFDLHCPMLSLPLALGTTLSTVPAATPYLQADPAEVAAWQARLPGQPHGAVRVGLVWAGDPTMAATDGRRSLAPERLAPLLGLPGVQFVSLQKYGPPPPAAPGMIDLTAAMTDFAAAAALVATLDLVIAVDTAAVHLAGAVGTPVWMLDRFDSCWRWLKDRQDSPWYPALRLYRQEQPGLWDPVIQRVAGDLRALAGAGAATERSQRSFATAAE